MINTICVCGAGTMGSGIAQVCAQAGYVTIQFDVNAEMVAKSKLAIEKGFRTMVDKARMTAEEMQAASSNLIFTSDINNCKADIVIEAIIEKLDAKVSLFNQLSSQNSHDTIFATNTSSLSITEVSKEVENPSRVVGMHFFNPAPVMKLVEVVKGENTSIETAEQVYDLVYKLGKTAVMCKDAPGFIVNRVARPYYLQAMKMAEMGMEIEAIDKLMEATGFKMGPFKLMDLIGMDINYSVSNIVWEALGKPERLEPSSLQKQKVDAGNLGKKSGKGFYDYNSKV